MTSSSGTQTTLEHVTNRRPRLEGIQVVHVRNTHDEYGARSRDDGGLKHMNNTEPTTRGWLGNPYPLDDHDDDEGRRNAIHAFYHEFRAAVEQDPEFRAAVEDLRGQRVACWCRGSSQDRHPGNWCHLDVVDAWLTGDLQPVHDYLQGEP